MRIIITALITALVASAAQAQDAWWNRDYSARRPVKVYAPGIDLPGDDSAIVTFYTGGRLRDDGADIRVVAAGKEVPSKLYGLGPGDTATVGFKVVSPANGYYIYFGNPNAAPPDYRWEPQRGLILETRELPNDANPRNLTAMADIWVRSKPFFGAGEVERVWQGQNMFGPSRRFSSRYVGWLVCPAQGSYGFATSSDDASFLLLDGKQVVAWPGTHGPVGDSRHNATVKLGAGVHRFEYLHLSHGGTTCAVAAWRKPGADGFEVIPESAFAPLSRAEVGAMEIAGEGVPCDFDVKIAGEALMSKTDELYAVRMAFVYRGAVNDATLVQWDFGDGQEGRGPLVSHVYLNEGMYPVTMTLGQGRTARSVTNRVQVHMHWGWQTKKEIDDIAAYVPEISKYAIDKLDGPSCVRLMVVGADSGAKDLVRRIGLSVVGRAASLGAGDVDAALRRMRETLGVEAMAADNALVAAFSEGFKAAKGKSKALIAVTLSDLLLERGAVGDAESFTKAALAETLDKDTSRRLFIAYGNAARYAGDASAAHAAFAAAEEIPLDRSALQRIALTGGLAFKVEDYLKHEEYPDARDALDQWEWEKPLEILAGYSSYLRGRLYHAQKRDKRALAELGSIVAVSPESSFAPKALLLMAGMELSGNREAARAALDRIVKEYETSPEVPEARKMLKGLAP